MRSKKPVHRSSTGREQTLAHCAEHFGQCLVEDQLDQLVLVAVVAVEGGPTHHRPFGDFTDRQPFKASFLDELDERLPQQNTRASDANVLARQILAPVSFGGRSVDCTWSLSLSSDSIGGLRQYVCGGRGRGCKVQTPTNKADPDDDDARGGVRALRGSGTAAGPAGSTSGSGCRAGARPCAWHDGQPHGHRAARRRHEARVRPAVSQAHGPGFRGRGCGSRRWRDGSCRGATRMGIPRRRLGRPCCGRVRARQSGGTEPRRRPLSTWSRPLRCERRGDRACGAARCVAARQAGDRLLVVGASGGAA